MALFGFGDLVCKVAQGSTMNTRKYLLLLNSVVALFLLEGIYYVFRMVITLLTNHRLVVEAGLVCIVIGAELLSRKKVWRLVALVYIGLALITTLYVLRATLLFMRGPIELSQIVGLPFHQLTPEMIFSTLLLILIVRVYEFSIIISALLMERTHRVK